MKRHLFCIFMIMSCLAAVSQNITIDLKTESRADIKQSDFQSLRAIFSYSSLECVEISTEKGLFSKITIDGTYISGDIGAPELPATHELLAVPFGATPKVSVINYTSTDYKLSDFGINTIIPRQLSVRKDQNIDEVPFVYDEIAYQKRGLANAPEATIEVQGTMRGIRIGSLVIYPVSYNAKDNTIRVFNDIEVEIEFEGADIAETERMLVNTYSPYFDIVYKQMFNYRQIMDVYDDHPDLMAYPVHMIVIAPENYISTLHPWVKWKIQKGFDISVYTTAQTGTSYNSIRNFVRNLYNVGVNWGRTPTFLILAGDVAQIPTATGSQTGKVTDLYYGSVDNDYFPDMYYSRMPAENTEQLSNIINKILKYEQYTMPNPSYLSKVSLIAGWDSYWNPFVGTPTVNYAKTYYYNNAHGFTQVNSHVNYSQYPNCYNALNTGVGFVNFNGHGNETCWAEPQFSTSDVIFLTNTDKYFLAMGNCCLSGDFGNLTQCLGESMIREENKGAYTYIGSCPNTYWYDDYYFNVGATNTFSNAPTLANSSTGVYDAIWMNDTYNTVSSMTFLGNLAVCYANIGGYQTSSTPTYYWEAYHVLGDGSIMPYRINPTANNVSHASSYPADATSFNVHAEAGSYVGITKNNELLGAALVPESGSVDVPVTPVTTGYIRIVVTKPQRQPYIRDIMVPGTTPQYTITATASPSNGGTVTGAGTYEQGTECTLTATAANANYQFVNWTKNNQIVSTNATYTFTVNQSGNYVANFSTNSYNVTVYANPAEGGTITGGGTYAYGSTCTITARANEGYRFSRWMKNGSPFSHDKTVTTTITNNVVFEAQFVGLTYQVDINVCPPEGGTVSGDGIYNYGQTVSVDAEANEGYTFLYWVKDNGIVSTEKHYEFIVTDNSLLRAFFRVSIGIDEQYTEISAIYPNPVGDRLIIKAENSISNVEIYNPAGLMVLQQECDSDNVEIDVSNLNSGGYFMIIMVGDTTETRRFVKE